MNQPAHLEESHLNLHFLQMAPKSYITRRNSCVNLLADILEKQDELAGARSDAGSNKFPTPPEALTLSLVFLPAKNLFTKFIKVFMETTQAQAQASTEPREHLLKTKTPETYWNKFYMKCYHFCQ